MKRQALLGSGVVAIGLASSALLAPQAAHALDFTFKLGVGSASVSGLIEGLFDNAVTFPDFITLTDTGSTGAPTGVYSSLSAPYNGFAVQNGQVSCVGVSLSYSLEGPCDDTNARPPDAPCCLPVLPGATTYFQDTGSDRYTLYMFSPFAIGLDTDDGFKGDFDDGREILLPPSSPLVFQSVSTSTSVPGPLPVFGAAAAFGYSRKLRKRIKRSTPVA